MVHNTDKINRTNLRNFESNGQCSFMVQKLGDCMRLKKGTEVSGKAFSFR